MTPVLRRVKRAGAKLAKRPGKACWEMIRLERIYNFLLFHAIILSVLDVLYALICYFI